MGNQVTVVLASAALGVAALALVFAIDGATHDPAPHGATVPVPAAAAVDHVALANRIDALERRLEALAARPTEEQRVAAEPIAEPAADAREARLLELERAVAALRSQLAGLGPMPETVPGIVAALADKNLHGHDLSPEQRQRRRELWTRFLELAPRDPQAPNILEQMFNELLAEDPRASLVLLDRHERMVDLPTLRADRLRANGLSQSGDYDAARTIHARLAADRSLTEAQRADAAFWHAHTWKQQGRHDEARREFAALIARCATAAEPELEWLVAGARVQIEEIDRWQQDR